MPKWYSSWQLCTTALINGTGIATEPLKQWDPCSLFDQVFQNAIWKTNSTPTPLTKSETKNQQTLSHVGRHHSGKSSQKSHKSDVFHKIRGRPPIPIELGRL